MPDSTFFAGDSIAALTGSKREIETRFLFLSFEKKG